MPIVTVSDYHSTIWGVPSFVMFCYVFLWELCGPAWAVDSYSIGSPAGGIFQSTFNKISRIRDAPECTYYLVYVKTGRNHS